MLRRNLLFLAVVAVGIGVFAASLFPTGEPAHWQNADVRAAGLSDDASFQATVAEVDAAFRQLWRELGESDELKRKNLRIEPSPRADDLTLMRRISLALTGTIPSLEEIRMFQRMSEGRDDFSAVAWWTAGLLEDRRSSDYLAERFARAYVGVEGGPFLIYRRRRFVSWLADELHNKRPYDRIVRQLIASDGLWTSQPSTNFITVTINPDSDIQGPDETKLAARVYRAFLGIRIDCAQCHDHPSEDWDQESFHRLAAFFSNTNQSFTGIRERKDVYKWEVNNPTDEETVQFKREAAAEARERGERFELADDEPLIVRLTATPQVPFGEELLPEQGNLRRRLAGWVTHPKNRQFARATVNRAWAILFGRPLAEPIDDIPIEGDVPQALDILADDLVRSHFDLRRLIQLIVATEAFQRSSYEDQYHDDEQLDVALDNWACFQLTRLRPEQVVGSLLQACSVQTIDYESHVIWRVLRSINENQFIERYGDAGADEFLPHGGTITQRLLVTNGQLVKDRTEQNLLANASTQIATLAPDDKTAVESAYLAVLSRLPTRKEADLYVYRLRGTTGGKRNRILEDMYATLLNSRAFSWNH